MTTQNTKDIHFHAEISGFLDGEHSLVRLFIEKQKPPIVEVKMVTAPSQEQMVDSAFQIFIQKEVYKSSVKNAAHREHLKIYLKEKEENLPVEKLTYRFTYAEDFTGKNLKFVLTTRKLKT